VIRKIKVQLTKTLQAKIEYKKHQLRQFINDLGSSGSFAFLIKGRHVLYYSHIHIQIINHMSRRKDLATSRSRPPANMFADLVTHS